MISVVSLDRPIVRRFRIYREVRTTAGIARRDVPFLDGDALTLHAESAEQALVNARKLVRDTRNLIAVPQES